MLNDLHIALPMAAFIALLTGIWFVNSLISRRAFQKLTMFATLFLFGAVGVSIINN